tara:strand:+ start:16537 stop:16716 length:180 start_codon:yes stop_codon:yes gene_type:complete
MTSGGDIELRRLLRKIDQLLRDSDKVSRLLNQASLSEISSGVIDINERIKIIEKDLDGN